MKSNNKEIGSLWQGGTEKTFDDLVKVAVESFYRKRKFYPTKILVNPSVEEREFQNIPLVKDKQMYSKNLICMMYENKSTKENDNVKEQ